MRITPAGVEARHPLDELAARVPRVGGEDDVTHARRRDTSHQQPIAGQQGRCHRAAAHLDHVEAIGAVPGRRWRARRDPSRPRAIIGRVGLRRVGR